MRAISKCRLLAALKKALSISQTPLPGITIDSMLRIPPLPPNVTTFAWRWCVSYNQIQHLNSHYKDYARNTPGSICQYKEDGLVSRPPSLFTSMRRPMHGTSCPKYQLKSTCLTAKFGSFLDHAETGEKGQNVISSSVQHPISVIFVIHVSVIIPLPMMWILLTKPIQKSLTTVCLHCSFARLKNKHIGVLETNVATISWLHWSPVSGYI